MARRTKEATALRKFVVQAGGDPRTWTDQQRAEHNRLVSTAQDAELDAASSPKPRRRWFS